MASQQVGIALRWSAQGPLGCIPGRSGHISNKLSSLQFTRSLCTIKPSVIDIESPDHQLLPLVPSEKSYKATTLDIPISSSANHQQLDSVQPNRVNCITPLSQYAVKNEQDNSKITTKSKEYNINILEDGIKKTNDKPSNQKLKSKEPTVNSYDIFKFNRLAHEKAQNDKIESSYKSRQEKTIRAYLMRKDKNKNKAIDESNNYFAALGLTGKLVERLDTIGLKDPFEVQRLAIPAAIDGRDLLCKALT
eukprot:Ihof_evm4s336 gene=Ihof_evmTU4s336